MGERFLGVMVAVVIAGTAVGCSSTRVVQRDGCWVKQTESFPRRVNEEMGPCTRKEPKWSEDRLARLVQECMVQADYRWQNRALAAWSKGQPLPSQESEEAVLQTCMNEAAQSMITENEALKSRIAELSTERDDLRVVVGEDRSHIRDSHDRVVEALGEAAKKPAPAAIATATSSGTATTKSDQTTAPDQPALTTYVTTPSIAGPASCSLANAPKVPNAAGANASASKGSSSAKKSAAKAPACDPAKAEASGADASAGAKTSVDGEVAVATPLPLGGAGEAGGPEKAAPSTPSAK